MSGFKNFRVLIRVGPGPMRESVDSSGEVVMLVPLEAVLRGLGAVLQNLDAVSQEQTLDAVFPNGQGLKVTLQRTGAPSKG